MVTVVTFSLGLLELSASRLDVALHQNPDHLLPVRQLAVFRSLTVSLNIKEVQFVARWFVDLFQYNPFIVYHGCDRWVFILRITRAAAAKLFKCPSGN